MTGGTREEERCRRLIEHQAQGGGERPVCHNTKRREEESARCMRSGMIGAGIRCGGIREEDDAAAENRFLGRRRRNLNW
ncbi:hypothetical protein [Aquicoccus sp. SU-CL01552]|uniref:hypothetical protein n=1 Tax=Aquicoccus sp. SU-CL01552 TaxID=3127656 RepID=UPI00333EB97C